MVGYSELTLRMVINPDYTHHPRVGKITVSQPSNSTTLSSIIPSLFDHHGTPEVQRYQRAGGGNIGRDALLAVQQQILGWKCCVRSFI